MSKLYGFFGLLWIVPFDTMTQKIYARSVMKMGHEPQHSLMITIPRKICSELQIDKGTVLYFKLEENKFVVSKDSKLLESVDGNDTTITVESMEHAKERNMDISVGGVSLADLQY